MKKLSLFLLAFLSVAISCKQKDKSGPATNVPPVSTDSFMITDSSWGFITAGMAVEDVKKTYGNANVKDERICGPECMDSIDVTKVFPGQPDEFTIYWNDTAYHRIITAIECYGDQARWHSADSIKIGSGLKDLLRVNGKKISFYGFGWDYGGTISSYNEGKLDKSNIHYRLELFEENMQDQSLYGDTGLESDLPAVQKVLDKIKVWWITLSLNNQDKE
ncbi:MAG: hypothetical protein KAX45_02835 [Chitinophagaceae bacterium]|nr:hypothetical protein [Chitinophagaceae bacterium]MBP8243453.1 hypothetical protein [Chitinophagaceae bacterium]